MKIINAVIAVTASLGFGIGFNSTGVEAVMLYFLIAIVLEQSDIRSKLEDK